MLAPTRELAVATQRVCLALGEFIGIKVCGIVGGTHIRDSIQELKQGAHVVVGTPGGVMAMIDKGHLGVQELRVLVLDEVCCTV